jgi:Zn-dependent peptidase ImmA (M78 family)
MIAMTHGISAGVLVDTWRPSHRLPLSRRLLTMQLRAADAMARLGRRAGLTTTISSCDLGVDNARREARRLLRRLRVESAAAIDIELLAKQLDVDIVDVRLDGATAQLVIGLGHRAIYLSDRLIERSLRRWAIAHELGHLVLDHPSPPLEALSGPRPHEPLLDTRDVEVEADCFALELLTPACAVRAVHNGGPVTLRVASRLARMCGVSMEASAIRIAESTENLCAAVLSDRAGRRWIAPSPHLLQVGGSTMTDDRRLDSRSIAKRYFDHDRGCEQPELVPAAAWLAAPAEGQLVLEHSLPGTQPGTVLTMLSSPLREVSCRSSGSALPVGSLGYLGGATQAATGLL